MSKVGSRETAHAECAKPLSREWDFYEISNLRFQLGVGCGMWDGDGDDGLGMWDVGCGMWDVGCGRWEVGGGRWEVGGGRWEVGGGRWEVGGGRWEVGGGRWEVGGGRWDVVLYIKYNFLVGLTVFLFI